MTISWQLIGLVIDYLDILVDVAPIQGPATLESSKRWELFFCLIRRTQFSVRMVER
jgi:hypothetical protein